MVSLFRGSALVLGQPDFSGRLLFPVDTGYWSGETLGDLRLTYYSHIDPDETVEIVNTLKERALAGETIFYDIYTDEVREQAIKNLQECSNNFTKNATTDEIIKVYRKMIKNDN